MEQNIKLIKYCYFIIIFGMKVYLVETYRKYEKMVKI